MGIINEMKQMASLMSGNQREYFDQMVRDARSVKVLKLADVLTEEQVSIIKKIKIQQKQCYKNATLITQAIPDVEYVEGKVGISPEFFLPIEHAWNKLGDKYFDATAEILGIEFGEYVFLIEVNSKEVMNIAIENEFYGDVYRFKYLQRLKSKK